MRKIADRQKLDYFISKYNIDEIFSMDMKRYMELFVFAKNEFICKADESLNYLYFFVEGKAKVYSTLSNGKSLLLYFYKSFKCLGDVELLKYENANSNVQVIEESYCIGISMENIRKYVLDDAVFLKYICDSLGEKLIRLSKYSSINLLYPLENRLASYLLANITDRESDGVRLIAFEGNMTEVAELLGTSHRHLLRTINILSREGLIKKRNNYYEILDVKSLQSLAGDLYE
ncbi:MAG: cyclic nucleotide-binding domain protein [Clostridia bacterium]|jgi:CRP-like cAMP-binding protein|nr:cyclic nucleotide-binding domain protein [Clostridia bacterium]